METKNILVVIHNDIKRGLIVNILKEIGYRTWGAKTHECAKDMLSCIGIDMILIEWNGNGSLLQEIENIPVVIMINESEKNAVKSISQGIILKPFSPPEVKQIVQDIIDVV